MVGGRAIRVDIVRAASRLRRKPHIWVFHDVGDVKWFAQCITEISSTYRVVPLIELARNRAAKGTCAITFDDGRRSVLDVARPILSEGGIPYTVFVCTDVLTGGQAPWFIRLEHIMDHLGLPPVKERWKLAEGLSSKWGVVNTLKDVPFDSIIEGLDDLEERYPIPSLDTNALFLSGEEVRQLAAEGVTIGSHTHRHPILSHLSAREQEFEVNESVDIIEGITGRRPIEFAYPNGTRLDYNGDTLRTLRDAGIEFAVTVDQRYLSATDDALTLPRIGLDDGASSIRRSLKRVAPPLSFSQMRDRRYRSGA